MKEIILGGSSFVIDFQLTAVQLDSSNDLEVLTVKISSDHPVIFCVVYVPPNSCFGTRHFLFTYLHSLFSSTSSLVFVLGDFNLSDLHWDTLCGSVEIGNSYCELMFELNLSQLINMQFYRPHVKGNTLDLIITNSYESVSNVLIDKTGKFSLVSDHYPVTFSSTSTPLPSPCPSAFRIYDYSKANLEGLSEFLIEAD